LPTSRPISPAGCSRRTTAIARSSNGWSTESSRHDISHAQQKAGIGKQDVVSEFTRNRAGIDEAVDRFAKDHFVRSTRTVAAVAAAYVIIANNSARVQDRESFFTKLCDGARLEPDSPILHLRGKLLGALDYNAKRTEARLELILRHWNAWITEAPVATIRMQGKFPNVTRRQ
jgi:hypothetical protein